MARLGAAVAVGLLSLALPTTSSLLEKPPRAAAAAAPAAAPMGAPGSPSAPAEPTLSPQEHITRAEKGLEGEGAFEDGFQVGASREGVPNSRSRIVQHDDKKTMTHDFGREYGPHGPDTLVKVCQKNPNNKWCREHA